MKTVGILLLIVHAVTAVGAMAGGYACIVDPISPIGAPVSLLEGSPFDSFLIPGIVLFGLFGVGNLLGFIALVRKTRWYGYVGGVLGGGMLIWIVIQVVIISTLEFLHVVFFCVGLFQSLASYRMLAREQLFPTGVVTRIMAAWRS